MSNTVLGRWITILLLAVVCLVGVYTGCSKSDAQAIQTDVNISWDPVDHDTLLGYEVSLGTEAGVYTQTFDVDAPDVSLNIPTLEADCTQYFSAVRTKVDNPQNPGEILWSIFSDEAIFYGRPLVSSFPKEGTVLNVTGHNFAPGVEAFLDGNPSGVTRNSCSNILVDHTPFAVLTICNPADNPPNDSVCVTALLGAGTPPKNIHVE